MSEQRETAACPKCGDILAWFGYPGNWKNQYECGTLVSNPNYQGDRCLIRSLTAVNAKLQAERLDDKEAVTSDWLLSVGFEEGQAPKGSKQWEKTIIIQEHGFGQETRHWLRVHEPIDEWWPIDLYQQGSDQEEPDGVALISWIDYTTRGHVRRLLAALGIDDESTKEKS